MGAAKNARKARRKADRREDRRPYFYFIEDVEEWRKPWHQFPGPSSVIVSLTNSRGERVKIGYRENLTHKEAQALLASGLKASKEPKTWVERTRRRYTFDIESAEFKNLFSDFGGPFPTIDQSLPIRSVTHRFFERHFMQDYDPRYVRMNHVTNNVSPPITGKKASMAIVDDVQVSPTTLDTIDFSALEERILEALDKKAAYAAMYGATSDTIMHIYEDKLTAAHKVDVLDRVYRGERIGDIVSSHPLNQRSERDDEDHQEVARVSGDRS